MPRTVDAAVIAAMANMQYDVTFNLVFTWPGHWTINLQPVAFKLGPLELEIEVVGAIGQVSRAAPAKVILERKINVAGTVYTYATSMFTPIDGWITSYNDTANTYTTKLKAHIAPPNKVSFTGDDTYKNVITAFCTAIGKTAVFRSPAATYWSNMFYPTGRNYTTNDAKFFFTTLRQKYFIYACDNGNEEILFYAATDCPVIAPTVNLNCAPIILETGTVPYRYFVARDENDTVRTSGNILDPYHNLGYLKSTDNFPVNPFWDWTQADVVKTQKIVPDLTLQSGDFISINSIWYVYPLEVTESFDRKTSPTWGIELEQIKYFNNTDGGPLPSTIMATAPYTPLFTSGFNRFLDPDTVNNLQALATWVDDHAISAETLHALTQKNTPVNADEFNYWDSVTSTLKRITWANFKAFLFPNENVKVYKSANQTLANSTWTAVSFDEELYDTDNIHNVSTNNTRLTCKVAGKYIVTSQVVFAINTTGARYSTICLNGGMNYEGGIISAFPPMSGDSTWQRITTIMDLAINDYVEVFAIQFSGGNLDLLGNASGLSCRFSMSKIF
jgi:hypothetical protein